MNFTNGHKFKRGIIYFLMAFSTSSALLQPIVAGETTLGELSARIDDLENQLSGDRVKTDEANPGARVSHDDLERLNDKIRNLQDDVKRLELVIADLRSRPTPSKSTPSLDEPFEKPLDDTPSKKGKLDLSIEKPFDDTSSRKSKTEFNAPMPAPHPIEKDENIENDIEDVIKLLEQTSPADADGEGPKGKKKKDLEEVREVATKHAEESTPTLTAGSAEAQHNEADALHNSGDYKKAEKAFNSGEYKKAEKAFTYFIKTYPDDPQIPEAMYWKAQSCLKLGKSKEAKILFVNSYKKNPKGQKSAECLLKLGEALALEEKKDYACTTWRKLKKDFPQMTSEMKTELGALKEKYGCDLKSEKVAATAPKS